MSRNVCRENQPTVNQPTLFQPTEIQPTENQPDEDDELSLTHAPSFACNCNDFSDFFGRLQDELDEYQIDFDIECQWINLHFPRGCTYEDNEFDEDTTTCIECDLSAFPWSTLCQGCDNQFGGPEGFAANEREHWMAASESDSNSDDDLFSC